MAVAGLLSARPAPIWRSIPARMLLCFDMAEAGLGLGMVEAVGERGEWRFLLCRSDEHEIGACCEAVLLLGFVDRRL